MSDVETVAPAADTVVTQPPSVPVGTTDTPPTTPSVDPQTPAEAATPSPDEKIVKKPWYQKKIAEQAYQLREAQRLNDRLLGLIETNRKTEVRTGDEAPDPTRYNTLPEYLKAAVEYETRHSTKQEPKPEPQPTVDPHFEAERENLLAEGLEKYEDFQELIHDEGLKITPFMANAVLEAEDRVEVAYYLAKNPKEAARISRLTPVRQIAEIARIEDKINAKPIPKKPSTAPTPVNPVSGVKTSDEAIRPGEDFETFRRKFASLRRK